MSTSAFHVPVPSDCAAFVPDRPDRAAFDRTAEARARVDLTRAPAYSLDAVYASAQALGIANRLKPFRDAIASLPGFDIAHYDHLEDCAHALLFVQWTLVSRAERVNQLPQLASEGFQLRTLMLAYADALALKGRVPAKVVARLREGSGYRDLVEDLGALVAIFREVPDATGPFAPVTAAEVQRAFELAEAMSRGIGAQSDRDLDHDTLVTERHKLAVLLLNARNQLLRAMSYLRFEEGDAAKLVPSLYVPAKKSGSKASTEPEPAAAPATAADTDGPFDPDGPFQA